MCDRVIKAYMVLRGITQRDLAKMLGITTSSLNHKINGKVRFSIDEMESLSQILEVGVEELFFNKTISKMKISTK